jgi:hypothetical protein
MHAGHTGGDRPAVRGMLIVGESHVYLSPLPIFHPPHDFHVPLDVTLRENGGGRPPAPSRRCSRAMAGTIATYHLRLYDLAFRALSRVIGRVGRVRGPRLDVSTGCLASSPPMMLRHGVGVLAIVSGRGVA